MSGTITRATFTYGVLFVELLEEPGTEFVVAIKPAMLEANATLISDEGRWFPTRPVTTGHATPPTITMNLATDPVLVAVAKLASTSIGFPGGPIPRIPIPTLEEAETINRLWEGPGDGKQKQLPDNRQLWPYLFPGRVVPT